MGVMYETMQQISNSSAALNAANRVYIVGVIVYETDTKRFKIGDGVTPYATLPYATATEAAAIAADSAKLGGQLPAYYALASALAGYLTTSATLDNVADGTTRKLANYILTSLIGSNSGVCGLDINGKVSTTNLPAAILGALEYQGTWDCSTAVYPTGATTGQYWICSVAGTISGTAYAVHDWMVYNGTAWNIVNNQTPVLSVNEKTGTVELSASDVNALSLDQTTPQMVQNGSPDFQGGIATGTMQDDGSGLIINNNNKSLVINLNQGDDGNACLRIFGQATNQAFEIDNNNNTLIGSSNGELLVLVPQSRPSYPPTGGMYYDSGTNLLYIWNGTAWVAFLASSAFTADAIEALLGISSTNVTALANLTGSNTGDQTLPTLTSLGAVPTSRQVNGKALSANITLDCDDLSDGTNTHLVTTAQKTVIGNTSGTNTGDQTLPIDSTLAVTDNTTNNVSTSAHGFAPKAVAPAANCLNVDGIANGETVISNKTILDQTTSPSTQAFGDTAAKGTSLVAAHADHKHAMPSNPSDASLSVTDITTNNASTTAHGFEIKATAPSSGNLNVLGIANAETGHTDKLLLDTTSPSTQAFGDSATAGISVKAARIDHKHAMPATPTSVSGNAGTVTNASLATALTVDTGTVTIHGAAANTSALTLGAGASSVSGANTGDYNNIYNSTANGTTGSITPVVSSSTAGKPLTSTYEVTAAANALTINVPSGTPNAGDQLLLTFLDNGTARTITWTLTAGGYAANPGFALPTTTVISTLLMAKFLYRADGLWHCVAVA